MTIGTRSADPPGFLRRLPTVELDGTQTESVRNLGHSLLALVSKDTDRQDLGRQATNDVACLSGAIRRGDAAKDHADRVGAEARRQQGVFALVMPQILTNITSHRIRCRRPR